MFFCSDDAGHRSHLHLHRRHAVYRRNALRLPCPLYETPCFRTVHQLPHSKLLQLLSIQ